MADTQDVLEHSPPPNICLKKNLKLEKNQHLFRYGLRGDVNTFWESVFERKQKKIEKHGRNMHHRNSSGILSEDVIGCSIDVNRTCGAAGLSAPQTAGRSLRDQSSVER